MDANVIVSKETATFSSVLLIFAAKNDRNKEGKENLFRISIRYYNKISINMKQSYFSLYYLSHSFCPLPRNPPVRWLPVLQNTKCALPGSPPSMVWTNPVPVPPVPKASENKRQNLVEILDRLKDANFNTVLFQTRTRGDVLYRSKIEPFNSILTGKTAADPGYDPIGFCHRRVS